MERKICVLKGLWSFEETVTLRSRSIHEHITNGPFTGTKSIEVIPVDQFKVKLHIRWDIKLNGLLCIIFPAVSWYIARHNEKALTKMEERIMTCDSDLIGGRSS